MRVLITGANGFIGSRLVRSFLGRGDEVRGLVRPTSDRTLLEGVDPELVLGDVTRAASLPGALDGVDLVVHTAAALGATSQAAFDRVNVAGTENLVRAVLDRGAGRLVLVSSIAAAGPGAPGVPRREGDPPAPISRYGRSKLGGERVAGALGAGMPITIVRPPIVYGSAGAATRPLFDGVRLGLIPDFTGPPRRASFVHVDDLVRGIVLAATEDAAAGQTYFLIGPQDGTLVDFQREIARQLDVGAWRIPIPGTLALGLGSLADRWRDRTGRGLSSFGRDKVVEGLGASWVVSGAKAERELGYRGRIDLVEGIRETIEGYRHRGWL